MEIISIFQDKVRAWMHACFGPAVSNDKIEPDETIDVGFHAILLSKYHEQGYTDEFHNVINDAGGEFVVSEAGVEKSRYWRIDEVEGPVMMTVKELCDWDGNQRVEAAEIREFDLETWDFHRNTPIDGVEMEEFLFVEMSKVNGWFSLWIGTEIQPERIQLL